MHAKKSKFGIAAILLIIGVSILLFSLNSSRRSKCQKQEASYQAIVASYARDLHPGMTRAEAHKYLESQSISFASRRMGSISDDLIFIVREPSEKFYCSWQDVNVQIEYRPAGKSVSEPSPNDLLQDVKLERWLQDCL